MKNYFNLKDNSFLLWLYTAGVIFGIPAIVWWAINYLFAIHTPYLFWLFVITGGGFLFKFYRLK